MMNPMGHGLPPGWERIAAQIGSEFGRTLVLESTPAAFNSTGSMIDVYLDSERLASLEVVWDDACPECEVLRELRERIEELLAQELGRGI